MNQIAPQSQFKNKGEVFAALNHNLPLNDFRLPDHIYRVDLIPENIFDLQIKDRLNILDAAALPVSFEHGYPAINHTTPMWEQLPCEPPDAYDSFMTYLELPEKSNHENPIRLLPHISTLQKRPLDEIVQWCHMYYWHWRSRAYDLFLIAAHRKQREQRMMTIEGKHFALAEKTLNTIAKMTELKLARELEKLQDPEEADEVETKSKDLIDMMAKLAQIQRISVGLPANGVSSSSIDVKLEGPRHTTADETFKHVAKQGAGESQTSQRPQEMDSLLQDPDELSRVQDLLIRLQNPDKMPPAWTSPEDDPNIIDVEPEPLDGSDDSEVDAGAGVGEFNG